MRNTKFMNEAYTNPASGISYTNKDFNSIYSEELDMVKELTPKWDPTISNESDPGVVILKENAIIADKENYQIDKNVLETFPLSVSQYGNARQLYDALGSEMRWYRSATTEISYSYKGTLPRGVSIPVKKFTMVTDSTGEYVYTLIDPPDIVEKGKVYPATAIEGVVTDFDINGYNVVTLNALDADFRLYFNDSMVAENGIFIYNYDANNIDSSIINGEPWTKVHNLESHDSGQKIFSFGVLPNSNTCYVQFPQDIAELIGNGLVIKYVQSHGEAGNISSNTIDAFREDLVDSGDNPVSSEDITVYNSYSTFDGADPESLRSAYKNYKKTIGSFDTLVTCRDYENAIYNIVDDANNPVASNAVVSDRTNDINNSHRVITLTLEGNDKELVVDKTDDNPNMTAFDLGLYILAPMSNVVNATTYAKSFTVNNRYPEIEQDINPIEPDEHSYLSLCQHDFIDTTPAETPTPFIIKNFYDVNGKLLTYAKVTKEDAKDIKSKVETALYKNFNAREVNFGEPIEYDYLVEVIKGADPRIKSVILDEPSYEAYVMYSNEKEGTADSANTPIITSTDPDLSGLRKDILATLIANGNCQLYKFTEDFDFKFGQDVTSNIKNISTIKTLASIPLSLTEYEVQENEHIILTKPSYVSTKTFTYHVEYKNNGSAITKGTTQITTGGSINLKWQSGGSTVTDTIDQGTLIKSSIDIPGNMDSYAILGQTDTIELMELNQVVFDGNSSPKVNNLNCYWLLNNRTNTLFSTTDTPIHEESGDPYTYSYVLDQDEYFIYTDEDKSGLVILGSGTKIEIETNSELSSDISCPVISLDVDDITEELKDAEWYNFTGVSCLRLIEQDFIIASEGSKVTTDDTLSDLDNGYKPIASGKKVTIDGTNYTSTNEEPYSIRSRLDLNSSVVSPQKMYESQKIYVTYETGNTSSPTATVTIKPTEVSDYSTFVLFNDSVIRAGGESIDMSVLDSSGKKAYPASVISYNVSDSDTDFNMSEEYFSAEIDTVNPVSYSFSIPSSSVGASRVLIPVIVGGEDGKVSSISVNSVSESGSVGTHFVDAPVPTGSSTVSVNIEISYNSGADESNCSVHIGRLKFYDGYEVMDSTTGDAVKNIINSYSNINPKAVYDKSYRVDEDVAITEPFNADSFWDTNNPFNRFTIAQMRNCNVSVIKSSII